MARYLIRYRMLGQDKEIIAKNAINQQQAIQAFKRKFPLAENPIAVNMDDPMQSFYDYLSKK